MDRIPIDRPDVVAEVQRRYSEERRAGNSIALSVSLSEYSEVMALVVRAEKEQEALGREFAKLRLGGEQ